MGNIGVNVFEIESAQGSQIVGGSVNNSAIAVKSKKGPLGKAFLVTSIEAFKTIFGGDDYPNSYSYYCIKGLFDNTNANDPAPNLYIVREYNPADKGDSASDTIGSGSDTLLIEAGYRGDASPGAWGNDLAYQIAAGSGGKFFMRIFEKQSTGQALLVESSPEFDATDVEVVINTSSKYVKVTKTGTPVFTAMVWANDVTDLLVTASSGNASVTITAGDLVTAVSVPFNTSAAQTAADLAAQLNLLGAGVTVVSISTATVRVKGNTPGQDVTYTSPTGITATQVTAASSGMEYLTGGSNPGAASIGQVVSNLDCTRNKDVQFLFSTERFDSSWGANLEILAQSVFGSVTGILACDKNIPPTSNFSNYASLLIAHSYMQGIYNWGYVDREDGSGEILVPLIGHFYGAYIVRNRIRQGGFPHIAPAGVEVSIRGVNRLQYTDEITPELLTNVTRTYGWNMLHFSEGFGFILESSRTFSTTSKYYSVHIRNSKNYIIQAFKKSMKYSQQKSNNDTNRDRVSSRGRTFLSDLWNKGMFDDEGGFDNNVKIQCDTKNNDEIVRKQRKLVVDLKLNFAEIAEEVNLNMTQMDGSFTSTEI